MLRTFLILLFSAIVAVSAEASVRIKDIVTLQGVRDNQLVGYGLVVGLQGSGDTLTNSTFTQQALQSMLDRMGINVRALALRTRNVAAVLVTADLPPFIQPGSRMDVTVSSLGDATSLYGGTLILTSLLGVDGQTYAIAQGQVAVAGFVVQGQAETITQNVATAGHIPNGALVEREVPGGLRDVGPLALVLKNPDFNTSTLIADAINRFGVRRYGVRLARESDLNSVALMKPANVGTTRFMAEIGDLLVEPDAPARVVIDSRSGTIVIGQDVQVSTVAVTHGNLNVRVVETPEVSQPAPFSNGRTVVVPRTDIDTNQQGGHIGIVRGASLRELVSGLNRIGLKPMGIIAILQAIKAAGALHAELVVQ
ncbi:flagellar basal body P-ring protein FlgI [Methylocella tundrae]|uniref:Flagellar P-ring protein n=1 Tax=Methylocella tundrae TaxID=227605 RepID=A0A4U8YTB4_METTU|nr:flagellar basal body P-ring protein FlgI [Methylocella tundrae]WPP04727.1 flagellar basal body P-ring protein FlgI [Methylocella tundrae]VFU06925.1 flagellar basal body P-ring protein [Methylocella tundrae]